MGITFVCFIPTISYFHQLPKHNTTRITFEGNPNFQQSSGMLRNSSSIIFGGNLNKPLICQIGHAFSRLYNLEFHNDSMEIRIWWRVQTEIKAAATCSSFTFDLTSAIPCMHK